MQRGVRRSVAKCAKCKLKIFESIQIVQKDLPTSSQSVIKARLLGHFDRKRAYLTHGSQRTFISCKLENVEEMEERNDMVSVEDVKQVYYAVVVL